MTTTTQIAASPAVEAAERTAFDKLHMQGEGPPSFRVWSKWNECEKRAAWEAWKARAELASPLVVAPVELTDEQIDDVFNEYAGANNFGAPYLRTYVKGFRHIARAVLALAATRTPVAAGVVAEVTEALTDVEFDELWLLFSLYEAQYNKTDTEEALAAKRAAIDSWLGKHAASRVPGALVALESIEQYRMQMAGISTAALGYWKEGDSIHPDYDTVALRDVAKLYVKYDELFKARERLLSATPAQAPAPLGGGEVGKAEFYQWFELNYPSDTIIQDPRWHAPRIWRVAKRLGTPSAPPMQQDAAPVVAVEAAMAEAIGREWGRYILATPENIARTAANAMNADPTAAVQPGKQDSVYLDSGAGDRVQAPGPTDAERLDWLQTQGTAFGFEDMHEGNAWAIHGPFSTVRQAIDAAILAATPTEGVGS
jgi:hypothetical protein